MISVLILTLNEEQNLSACLASVAWCDDIVVLDSYSSDRTVEIATSAGARVIQRKFDNWAAHQNWAMENIAFRHPWVFYLDADERMTEPLHAEIQAIAANPEEQRIAFYGGRKNYFLGQWIKHAMPPCMIMRFFKPPHIRFERLVNPAPVLSGPHGYLKEFFDHYNFSKGITEWIDKHNKYSLLEALEGRKLLCGEGGPQPSLFSRDAAERRRALRNLAFRLPGRPAIFFVYTYFVKRGFLDGYAGFTYCCLQSICQYMIALKMKELERREKGLPV